jgi:hypothetical protein
LRAHVGGVSQRILFANIKHGINAAAKDDPLNPDRLESLEDA